MRIPFSALETRFPGAGEKIRINLFRSQGPMPNQTGVVWRPTMSATFHVPERFGRLSTGRGNSSVTIAGAHLRGAGGGENLGDGEEALAIWVPYVHSGI